jgi:alkane 1-monooxygenase
MTAKSGAGGLAQALPFWLSLTFIPFFLLAWTWGGTLLLLIPFYTWGLYGLLDRIVGLDTDNLDPETDEDQLVWYRAITLIWVPVQVVILFGSIYVATHNPDFRWWEQILLFFGVGVATGTVGINYSHELMHQKNRLERSLGDLLLAMVLYSHFRSEHLLVHHSYVATPRDPVTARYNEGFHRFFARVLVQCFASSLRAEKAMLARKKASAWSFENPFYLYAALQLFILVVAFVLGGWIGVALFLFQALVAVWQLELVNYVEHYGLTRRYLGDGRYEHVKPQHSWNAAHKVSNWLLINLQRHSDHHYKPDRRFPLLQNHPAAEAPQLPYGYPVMTALAMVPPVWRRFMNPRVRKWRAMFYPEVTDWTPYKTGALPMPKGAS